MEAYIPIAKDSNGLLWTYSRQDPRAPLHRHRELEFNLVVRGKVIYLIGERRIELPTHTMLWLFPKQDHVLIDASDDFEMWIGVLRPSMMQKICTLQENRLLTRKNPEQILCKQLSVTDSRRLGMLYQGVSAVAETDCDHFNAGLAYATLLSWSVFLAAHGENKGEHVHPAVERAVALTRDTSQALGIVELADHCGLSPARLSKLFKQQMGIGLVNFRNQQRINRFIHLYGRGHRYNMTEAALKSGFGSYAQFYRTFKDIMGESPAQYRNNMR